MIRRCRLYGEARTADGRPVDTHVAFTPEAGVFKDGELVAATTIYVAPDPKTGRVVVDLVPSSLVGRYVMVAGGLEVRLWIPDADSAQMADCEWGKESGSAAPAS